jgi:hypothetical protein
LLLFHSHPERKSMKLNWCLLLLTAVICSPAAHGQEAQFTAKFTGPDASASGIASLTLSADQSSLSYVIDIDGLDFGGMTATMDDDVIGLHIHSAPAGSNGPIVFGLVGSPLLGGALNPALTDDADDLVVDAAAGTLSGVWEATDNPSLTAALVNLLNSEGLYFNVHTHAFRGGAIRGQIVPVPEPATATAIAVAACCVAARRRTTA